MTFRVTNRFVLWGSSIATAPTFTYAESWAFPVTVQRVASSGSLVHGIPDLVEAGHKEN